MKRKVRKLKLTSETLRQLDRVSGGDPTECSTLGTSNFYCPTVCSDCCHPGGGTRPV